jgi:hypothetical protein
VTTPTRSQPPLLGVAGSPFEHFRCPAAWSPVDDWTDNWTGDWRPGTDLERRDYASLAEFTDPDGIIWVIQQIGYVPP